MTLPAARLRPTTAARDCSSNYLPGLFAKTICQDYLRASPAVVHSDFFQSALSQTGTMLERTDIGVQRDWRDPRIAWLTTATVGSAEILLANATRIATAAGVADAEVRLESGRL